MTGIIFNMSIIALLLPVVLIGVLLWLLTRAVNALESIAESLKQR